MEKLPTHKTYFEAIKKILDGKAVENLDKIRVKCNLEYLINRKGGGSSSEGFVGGCEPKYVMISFVADAENKILMGKDPKEVYNKLEEIDPEEVRTGCRESLKSAIEDYL